MRYTAESSPNVTGEGVGPCSNGMPGGTMGRTAGTVARTVVFGTAVAVVGDSSGDLSVVDVANAG